MDLSSFPSGKEVSGWGKWKGKIKHQLKIHKVWTPGDAVQDRILRVSFSDMRDGKN